MWKLVADQLEIAEFLASRADSRRPREAALRRAVSTAYYALFQALCEMCAVTLVGWKQPWAAFTPVFRAIDHGRTLSVLSERGPGRTHPLGSGVESIGLAFRELQTAREWADYNPEHHPEPRRVAENVAFSRAEALALVAVARAAVSELDSLDADARLRLAILLVTRSRKEARR